jgi:translation initiation factor 2 beta subunit (eIF-2beta)/eIF-5
MTYEYDLDYLLDRLYDDLSHKTDKTKKNILSKPNISIINKKTVITNIEKIADELNRKYSELESFISSELNMYITQTGEGHMIINGIVKQPAVEKQIKSYIVEHVQCHMCKSIDTYTTKEDRIQYLNCKKCKAFRSLKK